MTITKHGKEYTIAECAGYWRITRSSGGLTVEYKVNKDICKTEKDLREYIESENIF